MTRRLLAIMAVGVCVCGRAEVKPAKILQDGMVVEWTKPLTLWGTADPNEKFDIKINNVRKSRVQADSNGKWEVKLPALKPGGPYTIQIGDKTLKDVLSGDVVLCSGQSNMELYVYRVDDMFHDLISNYSNDNIRQFIAPKNINFEGPAEDLSGGNWEKTTPTRSSNFSALGYFIAMEMNSKTGRP
ncbi:MAG: sialate O-acetylesterase, partial [Muribaculaceae bacterium]|nr:sialate O-acetylesterase [Muribaculaceae bacterium]